MAIHSSMVGTKKTLTYIRLGEILVVKAWLAAVFYGVLVAVCPGNPGSGANIPRNKQLNVVSR
jgi:hypothetical protein